MLESLISLNIISISSPIKKFNVYVENRFPS